MKRCLYRTTVIVLIVSLVLSTYSYAQQKLIPKGAVQRIKIHGKSLEGNLSGDSTDRHVSVYLPASYNASRSKRYPVVYFLHGYTDDDAKFYGFKKHWMTLPPLLDTAFVKDPTHEMIIVTPDAYTRFQGSMYSNSAATGSWEDFIAQELVGYIDSHYRTISRKEGRGLCGHSMGGYGALRIGEKNPGVFSAVYLLSPCCLNSTPIPAQTIPPSFLRADSIRTMEQVLKADFGVKALFASAAAWSPNPNNPPFFLDLPVKDGKLQPAILLKWDANRPLNNLDQYIFNIKKLKAIGFDAGTQDKGIAESIKTLDGELNKYGVQHFFEIYEGDHINRVSQRIQTKMIKFFADNLSFRASEDVKK